MLTFRYVSAPRQLERVRRNADGSPTWQLHYKSCSQGICTKQITQQWRSHQWAWRLYRHPVSGYTARFGLTAISKRGKLVRIWTGLYFRFCCSNNKMARKPIRPRDYGQIDATMADMLWHVNSFSESYKQIQQMKWNIWIYIWNKLNALVFN
jgi:hypothetical protein